MTEWLLEKLAAGEVERSQFQCIELVISQLRSTIAKRLIDLTSRGNPRGIDAAHLKAVPEKQLP